MRSAARPVAAAAMMAAALAILPGCSLFGDGGAVPVAAIGSLHRNPDRAPSPYSLPDRLLLDATAGGLVAFGGDGQIEAGLAERWTVIDDGRSYIFRLREARWDNGRRVRSAEVAQIIQSRMSSPRLRPALRGEFRAVRDVRAMTARVIEIRLTRPMPDLLDLLAQPDMAVGRMGRGWGPWRARWTGRTAALFPEPMPGAQGSVEAEEDPEAAALLWGTGAAQAIAQFEAGEAEAVFGGRFEHWPLVGAADIADERIVIDPAAGLFGLAVVSERGVLATAQGRAAVSMAIDRAAIAALIDAPAFAARVTLRAGGPQGEPAPALPAWQPLDRAARIALAREAVGGAEAVELRIALPDGPGARLLFAQVQRDLAEAGITARRVTMSADADLRLIDEVAPSSDPAWALRRLGCDRGLACDPASRAALRAIDEAPDGAARAAAIAEADALLTAHGGFIALGAPLRWHLASQRLSGIRPNARSRHSLIRLLPSPD